jgi:hypothetical protein
VAEILPLRLLVVVVAQLFDLATFRTMIALHGPAAEANPIVAGLLVTYGFPVVVLAKVALIVLVSAATILLARGRAPSSRRMAALVVGVAIVGGLVGGWSNALVIGTA